MTTTTPKFDLNNFIRMTISYRDHSSTEVFRISVWRNDAIDHIDKLINDGYVITQFMS